MDLYWQSNMLSRLVITFIPKNKHLFISWLQAPSAVILEPKEIKSVTVSTVSPSICHEVMGPDAMIFIFWILSFKPAFSLSSLIKRLFSPSSLSAIRVASSAYLRVLIFLPAILIPACASYTWWEPYFGKFKTFIRKIFTKLQTSTVNWVPCSMWPAFSSLSLIWVFKAVVITWFRVLSSQWTTSVLLNYTRSSFYPFICLTVNILASPSPPPPPQKKNPQRLNWSHPQTVQWTCRGHGCFRSQAFPSLGLQLTQHVDLAQAVCESLAHSCQIPIAALTNSHKCSGLTQQRCTAFTALWVRIPALLSLDCHQGVFGIALFWSFKRRLLQVVGEARSLVLQDQGPCPFAVSPEYACQLLEAAPCGHDLHLLAPSSQPAWQV